MSVQNNLLSIKEHIPANVQLIAVSKTKPDADILEAYEVGQRVFGENKVQELEEKYKRLPDDIQWHMIGHLQSKKVKKIVSFVSLIHSVDSEKLLLTINKEAAKKDRVVPCLLQVHIAQEEHKFGFTEAQLLEYLTKEVLQELTHVKIVGLMGMATHTDDKDLIRQEFKKLKFVFDTLKHSVFSDNEEFKEISMGMSSDYSIAIEEGSTMVRVGSHIFGKRDYMV